MVPWRHVCSLGWLVAVALTPVSACGPFLFDNADLDQFSLLDPGILNSDEWTAFLAFASPGYGHEAQEQPLQRVIHADRSGFLDSGEVSNLVYDFDPGQDPLSVAANEAWWAGYFSTAHHRVTDGDLAAILYEGARPSWMTFDEVLYLNLMDGPPDDNDALRVSLDQARDPAIPEPLRHRHAFRAVRALALAGDPTTQAVFREFCPGPATDLPLARAQGWAASVLATSDPSGAIGLWLDLLVRWPELRAQTFSSLATLDPDSWAGQRSPEALVARFFLDGRDFSPETLGALAVAERAAGRDGTWTESVFYAMAEQIEAEAGVFALFGLVDPHVTSPRGLFTGLLDGAQELVESGVQRPSRSWWLIASYLALFDGDPARAQAFLGRARALPARNAAQGAQTNLLETLIRMDDERNRDWSPGLQTQVIQALDWALTLDGPDRNRGLYHSLVVLAAQKFLARGHNAEAALAFGLIQVGSWPNPYRVQPDDQFWSVGWPVNNAVNLLMDALMSDDDLAAWKTLLTARDLEPLVARVASHRFLSAQDLTWWQAHRALRRGQGDRARGLLASLPAGGVDSAVFPRRTFAYSLDLDPLHPASGRGMQVVEAGDLAAVMAGVESRAETSPSPQTLFARGQFWFSLQLSGMPLLFAQPPPVISFVNGNYEFYGYDGRDQARTTAVVGDFPLGQQDRTDDWSRRLTAFYRDEFTALGRAREAFEAVVARGDPEVRFQALLFLQALDGNRGSALGSPAFDGLPLAQELRATCEAFR